MTLESDAAGIGAERASCDVDLEHERPGILPGSSSGFRREESAERAAGSCARANARKVFGRRRRVGRSVANDSIDQTRN